MYSLAKQYEIADQCLKERLEMVLPAAMEESGIECWLIACREYNEDPIMKFITPSHYPTARRLSIFLFYHKDDVTKYISVSRPDPDLAKYYERDYTNLLLTLGDNEYVNITNNTQDLCTYLDIKTLYFSDYNVTDNLIMEVPISYRRELRKEEYNNSKCKYRFLLIMQDDSFSTIGVECGN